MDCAFELSVEVKTGISGFDEAFGGLDRGQVILVVGNAGAGKTSFCAKFLYEGAREYKEPALIISNMENKTEFCRYMRNIGMDFEPLEKQGLFRFVEMLTPTSPDAVKMLSEALVENATQMKAKRMVIDGMTPVLMRSISALACDDVTSTLQ